MTNWQLVYYSSIWKKSASVLNLCKKYQVPVVMDSDAHFDLLIGEFDLARGLLEKLDFPEELVLNRSVDAIKKYVNRKF